MPSFDKWGSMDFKMELREKNHIFSLWNIRAGDFDNTLPVNFDEEPFIYQASNVKKKFDKLFDKLLTDMCLLVKNKRFLYLFKYQQHHLIHENF